MKHTYATLASSLPSPLILAGFLCLYLCWNSYLCCWVFMSTIGIHISVAGFLCLYVGLLMDLIFFLAHEYMCDHE
jgi:hypothetical protein